MNRRCWMTGSAMPTSVIPDVLAMRQSLPVSGWGHSPGACAPAHAPEPGRSAAHDLRAGSCPPAVQVVEDRLQRLTGLPARGVNDPLAVAGLEQADLGSTVDGVELALGARRGRVLLEEHDTGGIEVGQVVREAAVLQRRDAALASAKPESFMNHWIQAQAASLASEYTLMPRL